MIPPDWLAYRREDGELVGYLEILDDGFRPRDLLGRILGAPADLEDAEAVVDRVGLAALAEPWLLTNDDGSRQQVLIVSVDAESAWVANADFAQVVGADIGTPIRIDLPTDRLVPLG